MLRFAPAVSFGSGEILCQQWQECLSTQVPNGLLNNRVVPWETHRAAGYMRDENSLSSSRLGSVYTTYKHHSITRCISRSFHSLPLMLGCIVLTGLFVPITTILSWVTDLSLLLVQQILSNAYIDKGKYLLQEPTMLARLALTSVRRPYKRCSRAPLWQLPR